MHKATLVEAPETVPEWAKHAAQVGDIHARIERVALACQAGVWFVVREDERIALDELILRGLVTPHEANLAKQAVRVMSWAVRFPEFKREGC